MKASVRPPIGQLLGRVLRIFRQDLYQRGGQAGYARIREAHLQVFGWLDWRGTRLTDLAARAGMAAPSMSQLVDELQALGYLERVPDPSDRRAKLIRPTREGRRLITRALRAVAEIEREYAALVGHYRFEAAAETLQALIEARSRS